MRILSHKYYVKTLLTPDSLIELSTTIPFLILYLTIDRTGAHRQLQFFIVFDHYRLFIIKRYTSYLDGDIQQEAFGIYCTIVANIIFYTCLLQHIENVY